MWLPNWVGYSIALLHVVHVNITGVAEAMVNMGG